MSMKALSKVSGISKLRFSGQFYIKISNFIWLQLSQTVKIIVKTFKHQQFKTV